MTHDQPAHPEISPRSARWTWWGGVLIAVLALVVFGYNLGGESYFVDEGAYLSQAFYTDLWFRGAWNDPAWLNQPAYDLPPLPKYWIGLALWIGGYQEPRPDAWQKWYKDTRTRFDQPGELVAARRPS